MTTTNDVLRRIKRWRNMADSTGWFSNAVAALDHFLGGTGQFVVIPSGKVASVKQESQEGHLKKSREIFKIVAVQEAGAQWLSKSGFPTDSGALRPLQLDFVLTFESGSASRGVTDDNLTYFGSSIHSEVVFRATQTTFPPDQNEGSFEIKLAVVEWKSWVVDNYDWEGDKAFGIFPLLGLPTQQEMNSLHQTGLAKSYQRSSFSWIVSQHGLMPWTETVYSMRTLKEVAGERMSANKDLEDRRRKEFSEGALSSPRPAEEMSHCLVPK